MPACPSPHPKLVVPLANRAASAPGDAACALDSFRTFAIILSILQVQFLIFPHGPAWLERTLLFPRLWGIHKASLLQLQHQRVNHFQPGTAPQKWCSQATPRHPCNASGWLRGYTCKLPQRSGSKAVELWAIGLIFLEIYGRK